MKEKDKVLLRQEHYGELLRIYSSLLTEVIRRRMESFYFDNLSLSEIAENEGVSRNAVHLSLLNGEKELDYYEDKLHLKKKEEKQLKFIQELENLPLSEEEKKILLKLKGEIQNGI